MMRMSKMVLVICSMALLSACGNVNSENVNKNQNAINSEEKENAGKSEKETVTIKTSPDKYTWYIKDYVGKNVASFGYTSLSGDRMDAYGDGYLRLILVNEEGNEIDTFPESQSYEEIVLAVKEVKSQGDKERKLTEISPSPDKYTSYIRDYTGRNLVDCGYISMMGDFRDAYSGGTIKFVITTDDGSYVDVSDEEALKKYVVTEQNIESNTELKLEYSKDETGAEYSNLVDSQNISEIELYVTSIEN